jgi:PhnB protein
METVNIPNGHQAVMPYLMLNNASSFQEFVQKVFGAQISAKHFQPQSEKIMHAEASIHGAVIMFCDSTEKYASQTANMFVYVTDADATFQAALENGGVAVTEPADQEYGRSCGISDPCGNVWWITSIS